MKRHVEFHKPIALLLVLGFLLLPSITFAKRAGQRSPQKTTSSPKRKFKLHNFTFDTEIPIATLIRNIAELERINVIFDSAITRQVETSKMTFSAKDISAPRALELILNTNRLAYVPVDKRTIVVFQDALANRQRFDYLMVRVFYLKDASLEEARSAIQIAFSGKQVQILPLKQLNALMVRDTEDNLKLMETLLTRIDKPKSEFVIDVNLYEVNDQTALQISNQSGSLSANASSLLQNKATSRLIGSTKLHVFENESAQLNMGKRVPVPVKTRRVPPRTSSTPATEQLKQPEQSLGQTGDSVVNPPSSSEEEQIQYVDVGLNIDLVPIVSEDNVQMKMSIEMTGATKTIPNIEFNQYRVKELVSFKKGETKIVANTFQLAGQFFASSSQQGNNANIIVTITPNLIRSPEVTPLDRSSFGPNGTVTGPDAGPSLEEVIIRAEQDEGQSR
jgi:general secretion pathway protein D